jgi:hypothetical protein
MIVQGAVDLVNLMIPLTGLHEFATEHLNSVQMSAAIADTLQRHLPNRSLDKWSCL